VNNADDAIKEIGKDLRYYIPVRIIPAGLHLIGIMLFTRMLNPSEFGMYVLVFAAISLLSPLMSGWLTQSNLRYYERNRIRGLLQHFMTTSVFAFLFSTALALFFWHAIGVLLDQIFDPRFSYLFRLGALTLASRCGLSYVLSILRASRDSRRYLVYVLVDAAGTLVVAYILIAFFGHGADAILLAAGVIGCAISCVELFRYGKQYVKEPKRFSTRKLREFLKYGVPLSAASVGSTTLIMADRFMIGYIVGAQAVGVYAAGYRVAQMSIILLAELVMLAAYPIVIQLFEKSVESDTRVLLENLIGMYVVILVPFVFIVAILSKDIADLMLGPAFRDAFFIFPWIAAGAFCSGLTMYVSKPFELRERTHFLLYLIAAASGLNIVMNLLLIPRYGIIGAAIASVLAYAIYLISSWFLSTRIFTWKWPWQTVAKALLSAMAMALAVYYANKWSTSGVHILMAKLALAVSVYSVFLLLLRERYFIKIVQDMRRML